MVFFSQAVAQTNDPLTPKRCSYDNDATRRKTRWMLPYNFYPWGVCFEYSDMWEFIPSSSYYEPFSTQERSWTKEAMDRWNDGYNVYKFKIWETYDVPYIPYGPLFVLSCDRDKYNILYIEKEAWIDSHAYFFPVDTNCVLDPHILATF